MAQHGEAVVRTRSSFRAADGGPKPFRERTVAVMVTPKLITTAEGTCRDRFDRVTGRDKNRQALRLGSYTHWLARYRVAGGEWVVLDDSTNVPA